MNIRQAVSEFLGYALNYYIPSWPYSEVSPVYGREFTKAIIYLSLERHVSVIYEVDQQYQVFCNSAAEFDNVFVAFANNLFPLTERDTEDDYSDKVRKLFEFAMMSASMLVLRNGRQCVNWVSRSLARYLEELVVTTEEEQEKFSRFVSLAIESYHALRLPSRSQLEHGRAEEALLLKDGV